MPWYTKLTLDDLVAQLQRANYAYHNNGHSVMSDDDYDRGLEELRRRSPAHPFLSVIGAPVPKGAVLLPVIMGSQDKVRAGEDGLARWLRRDGSGAGVKEFVVSEKLDGLSALLVLKDSSTKLYLRGDGVKGVNITSAIRGIQGIRAGAGGSDVIIRGELLLRKEDVPEGSIGRSLVNGWVHRGCDPDAELPEEYSKMRFVAYQVIQPAGMTRRQQMEWLIENKYEVPWWGVWSREKINEEMLTKGLIECKMMGKYPLDGLVVATNTVPAGVGGGETRNPSDSVAFKASLDDQKAETTVVGVTWTASRQGIWVPRIQIEPVQIGGANIQWLSGHNAGFIRDNGVGVGARIIVRRSGDVIPALDEVLERAAVVSEPAEGMWKWDEKKVQAVATDDCNPAKVLLHGLQTLGVEGVGPGLVEKLVEAGIDSMLKLWMAKEPVVAAAIGKGRAPALLSSLKEKRRAAGYMTLLIASNKLPRGVGERKLRVLFEKEPDPRKWGAAITETPAGWSEDSLKELWRVLPKALEWIDANFPMAGRPQVTAVAPAPVPSETAGTVVFTGVRDHALEEVLKGCGWTIGDSVTKKTTVVVVADGEVKESGKAKKARELGIEILGITAFRGRV
jgi:DNA ligase (NAD+)